MRQYLIRFFWVLLFIVSTPLLQLGHSKTLELVTLQYPPYEYEENGEIKGVAVDVVKEVFKRMGQPIKIILYPWARALYLIEIGQADAIFTAYKKPKREQFADYSKEILMQQTVSLCTLTHKKFKFDGKLTGLKDYKIGIVYKISYGVTFDNAINNKVIQKTVISHSGEENFKKLLGGYLDFTVSNTYGAIDILCKLGKRDQVKILYPVIEEIPSYIAFSKKRKLLQTRDKFDSVISKMKQDGTYDNIINSYIICEQGILKQTP